MDNRFQALSMLLAVSLAGLGCSLPRSPIGCAVGAEDPAFRCVVTDSGSDDSGPNPTDAGPDARDAFMMADAGDADMPDAFMEDAFVEPIDGGTDAFVPPLDGGTDAFVPPADGGTDSGPSDAGPPGPLHVIVHGTTATGGLAYRVRWPGGPIGGTGAIYGGCIGGDQDPDPTIIDCWLDHPELMSSRMLDMFEYNTGTMLSLCTGGGGMTCPGGPYEVVYLGMDASAGVAVNPNAFDQNMDMVASGDPAVMTVRLP